MSELFHLKNNGQSNQHGNKLAASDMKEGIDAISTNATDAHFTREKIVTRDHTKNDHHLQRLPLQRQPRQPSRRGQQQEEEDEGKEEKNIAFNIATTFYKMYVPEI